MKAGHTHTYDRRALSCTPTYDSRSPSRADHTKTYTETSRTPTTSRSPSRAYSAYSNDDDQAFDDARTYDDDDRSEARTYDDEGASAYDDGRSGSAFYDDGRSGTGSGAGTRYDDSRSESRSTEERTASRSTSRSARTYDDDRSAHSYDDAESGYDDAQSAAYDAQGSDYHSESQVSDGQNYPAGQGGRSQSARSQSRRSPGALSQGLSEGQYSEDDATSSSSINPQEILASLHSRTLDPVTFERKVLSTVEEQTERTSSAMSKLSSTQFASGGHGGATSGSEMSLSPVRRSGHSRAGSSEAASLFSPSTHGSFLSPGGPSHTPLKLFSPTAPLQPLSKEKDRATSLERPATAQSDYRSTAGSDHSSFLRTSASEQNLNLKVKEKEDILTRHPSATLGRRAGDLIAFFESGGGGNKPRSDAAKSVGSVSPSKLSVGLPARTFASGSGSGSGSVSGSEIGGGSSIASPFSRPRGVGVGLGINTIFNQSFPSRTSSPFRPGSCPASPTKSSVSGTGSFMSGSGSHQSGSYQSGAGSQLYGGTQTYRSDGASEAGRSETARSGASETYRSETARSGASDTY